MKKRRVGTVIFAIFIIIGAGISQADIVLRTDFTGFSTTETILSDFSWISELGEAANATTSLELSGSATEFRSVNPGPGGVGPAVGVRGNIETTGPWSTSFTFTPSQALDIASFEISSYSINGAGGHQAGPNEMTWSLEITSEGVDFSGSDTQTEPGGNAPQAFKINTEGTILNAGTAYTFTLNVSTTETEGNNVALDMLTLKTALSGAPYILDFSASPVKVLAGETISLSWVVDEATSLELDQGIGDVTGLSSTQVVVNADTTYTLTASNAYGNTNASVEVTLVTTLPVINSFIANKTVVGSAGGSVTLSWDVDDASSFSIDQGIGDVTGLSSTQVVVNADTTYTFTATNPNGDTSASVEITLDDGFDPLELIINGDFENPDITGGAVSVAIPNWNKGVGLVRMDETVTSGTEGPNLLPGNMLGVTNQAVRLGGVNVARMNQKLGHNWTASDSYTLDFNASELSFRADLPGDNLTVRILESESKTELWSTGLINLNGTHLGNVPEAWNVDWADNQTFSFTFNASSFADAGGIEGSSITIEFESKGVISVDNVSLIKLGAEIGRPVTDLVISGPVANSTGIMLSWTAEAGKRYSVETNSNLLIGHWLPFATGLVGDGEILSVTNATDADQIFYRIISE